MFAAAHKAVKELSIVTTSDAEKQILLPAKALPQKYSFRELYVNLLGEGQNSDLVDRLRNIVILNSCFIRPEAITSDISSNEYASKLLLWLSGVIKPDGNVVSLDDHQSETIKKRNLHKFRLAVTNALYAMVKLLSPGSPKLEYLPSSVLISLLSQISIHDPWTSPSSRRLAQEILSKYDHQLSNPTFISTTALQETIRPLFSSSNPTAITPAGRKAMPSSAPPKRFETVEMERKTKPWMYDSPWGVAVFEWAVTNISTEVLPDSLPLLLPPLLTILDSPLTPYRSRGLSMLSILLPKFPTKVLRQTGLGEVFEDAIMPTLLYLPTLTPVAESTTLLTSAYQALFVLAERRFQDEEEGAKKDGLRAKEKEEEQAKVMKAKMTFWDHVLRKGVFVGYEHAMEYHAIVEILIRETGRVVETMGIFAVKHLKNILPIITTVLTHPFSTHTPSLFLTTLQTLRTIISVCWPRIGASPNRLEVLKALVLSWRTVYRDEVTHSAEDEKLLGKVKEEIKDVGRAFVRAVEAGEKENGGPILKEEIRRVVEVDDTNLGDLFGVTEW